MLTGESLPVEKAPGAAVLGGSVNGTGMFRFRATRVGRDTALQQIIRLMQQAQSRRAPIARLADVISGVFAPVVLVIAIATFIVWFNVLPPGHPRHGGARQLRRGADHRLPVRHGAGHSHGHPRRHWARRRARHPREGGRRARAGARGHDGGARQDRDDHDGAARGHGRRPAAVRGRSTARRRRAAAASQRRRNAARSIRWRRRSCGRQRRARLPLIEPTQFRSRPGHGVEATLDGRRIMVGSARLLEEARVPLADAAAPAAALASRGADRDVRRGAPGSPRRRRAGCSA